MAQGFYERSPKPKVSTLYDQDDFAWINQKAREKGVSFAEIVRRCVKFARRSVDGAR